MVAQRLIPAGTTASAAVQEGLLASQRLPASAVPNDAVRVLTSSLSPLVLSGDVQPGELLLRTALVSRSAGVNTNASGLSIPAREVAVSLPFCLTAAVAGKVQAGSQVAVFDTYATSARTNVGQNCGGSSSTQPDINAINTQVVLPRVSVISVSSSSGGRSSAGTGAELVTFAVSQADAQRLITLSQVGIPYLALLTPSSETGFSAAIPPLFQP
jgi:pilus assembly protein CpaB